MFKTILQTVNQMHKLGVIHLGTDLIMKLKAQADFQTFVSTDSFEILPKGHFFA